MAGERVELKVRGEGMEVLDRGNSELGWGKMKLTTTPAVNPSSEERTSRRGNAMCEIVKTEQPSRRERYKLLNRSLSMAGEQAQKRRLDDQSLEKRDRAR